MLKLKYLTENFDLARFALNNWRHDTHTLHDRLQWFRISSNAVYPFDRDGQLCFLRLSPSGEKESRELLGELDFLAFLQRRGYPAMRSLPSDQGERLLLLDTPWGRWYASAFEGVPGRPLAQLPMTERLAETYGAALGRLHGMSMQYNSPIKRRSDQDALAWARQVFMAHAMPGKVITALDETARQLSALPHTRNSYGLVHYDFEPDNVFWDGEACHAIDFEDGMLHFYAMDVVQALDELPAAMHPAFLRGYRTACPSAQVDEEDFPLMQRFRNLYACARLLHCLSEKPVPEPEWMPQLTVRLENHLHELTSILL